MMSTSVSPYVAQKPLISVRIRLEQQDTWGQAKTVIDRPGVVTKSETAKRYRLPTVSTKPERVSRNGKRTYHNCA